MSPRLGSRSRRGQMDASADRLLKATEVSALLGVSQHVVLDWAQQAKIPSFKLAGKSVRFRLSEVLEWVEAQRREAAA